MKRDSSHKERQFPQRETVPTKSDSSYKKDSSYKERQFPQRETVPT